MIAIRRARAAASEIDVCVLVEGCYPYVPGGVSTWIDWLIRSQPDTRFSLVSLWPRPTNQPPRYKLPPNVARFDHVYLQDFGARPVKRLAVPPGTDALADALTQFMSYGGAAALETLHQELAGMRRRVPLPLLFNSPIGWQIAEHMYASEMPYGSFLHFFWAWRALLGGVLATLEFPLPKARVYHTISTGYAGVLAARAALETGRPALLTEHGLYTNERRVELLMAEWVADTVDRGHALSDPRLDLREMWIRAFEAYARTCYQSCTEVVTLYRDNQRLQSALGAEPGKLRVIANGIDVERYEKLERQADGPPTVALIGRVVPIKDVKTFIAACRLLADRVPGLRVWIVGPVDEDPDYAAECQQLVRQLGMDATITFTGTVDIRTYLPHIDVVALTSLSESQPLVLLEAGAAGVPFVATNVGSCREILEGRTDEQPRLGPGGIVTDVVAPREIAGAMASLLADPGRRRTMGEALRARVKRYYRSEQASAAYRELYQDLKNRPDAVLAVAAGRS